MESSLMISVARPHKSHVRWIYPLINSEQLYNVATSQKHIASSCWKHIFLDTKYQLIPLNVDSDILANVVFNEIWIDYVPSFEIFWYRLIFDNIVCSCRFFYRNYIEWGSQTPLSMVIFNGLDKETDFFQQDGSY